MEKNRKEGGGEGVHLPIVTSAALTAALRVMGAAKLQLVRNGRGLIEIGDKFYIVPPGYFPPSYTVL